MKKAFFIGLILAMPASGLWAQGCVTCTNTAAGLGSASAQGLNNGIIYLAALPLAFIGTIAFIWWRRNKTLPNHE